MKVMVATAVLTLLIMVGWDRPYQEQFAAFSTAYNQWMAKLANQPTPNVAPLAVPTPPPAPIPADTVSVPPAPPAPPAPPSIAGGKDSSWMWNKGRVLDNPRQDGIDQAGVHTFEPMLKNNPPPK
jgi:hypothetical protein